MAFRPKLWPTLFTVPALVALLALGTWQVDRLHWKQDLIEKLQERGTAAPMPLPAWIDDLQAWEYRRVTVHGTYLHDHEFYLVNRSLHGKPGLNIVTLLKRSDGGGHVLVNRGWVPFDLREPAARKQGQIEGEVAVEGIVRLAKGPGLFTPENEPHNNTWFFVDPASMTVSASLPPLQPYYVESSDRSVPGGYPVGHQWRVDIRNDHLEYAITWYALALALLVIYILYHRRPPEEDGTA